MKTLSTRLSALAMAFVMLLTCSSVAFAAEPDDVSPDVATASDVDAVKDDIQYVVMTINEEGITVETKDELPASARTSKTFVDLTRQNVLANSKESSSFYYPGTGTIVVGFAANGDGCGSLNITSNDFNFVAYSLSGQIKTSSGRMTGPQWVNWEVYAAGGSLSYWILQISGDYT